MVGSMPKVRLSLFTGQVCDVCSTDLWFAYQGYNRCECGQYPWIEKRADGSYCYMQGVTLPSSYRGWMKVTA